MPLPNAVRDLRLLRKHFRLRRLSRRRFSLHPRTGDALDYLTDLDHFDEEVYSQSFIVGKNYLRELIADWTDSQSDAYQRRLLTLWLAPRAPAPPPGPHHVHAGVQQWPDAEVWSAVREDGEGM